MTGVSMIVTHGCLMTLLECLTVSCTHAILEA
jgi:hypothetical protein